MAELILTKGTVEVGVIFDQLQITIECGDEYQAQSAYDEIVEILREGSPLTLKMEQPVST